ncbi:MAG: RluA family pseudouridine synthase, partial [bacterium]|nr:RluA family pseudouridine synthase [bacterium]
KTKEGNRITDQFKRQTVVRRYMAVVAGRVKGEQGRLEGYLAPADLPRGQKVKLVPRGKGKRALTQYTVLERYGDVTLLEVLIKTGRTHQIRVQLAGAGHPIVGDKIYGDPAFPFKRQALHASYLLFKHPVTGKKMEMTSKLPRDLRRFVLSLQKGKSFKPS